MPVDRWIAGEVPVFCGLACAVCAVAVTCLFLGWRAHALVASRDQAGIRVKGAGRAAMIVPAAALGEGVAITVQCDDDAAVEQQLDEALDALQTRVYRKSDASLGELTKVHRGDALLEQMASSTARYPVTPTPEVVQEMMLQVTDSEGETFAELLLRKGEQ